MRALWIALCACLLLTQTGKAEEYALDDTVYKIYDEAGAYVTSRAGMVYAGDEYIASDNRLYRVEDVDAQGARATAVCVGTEPQDERAAFMEFVMPYSAHASAKKLICMYSTHSDESYVEGDGASSKTKNAGIYDVGEAFKENLEALGIEVTYSDENFLPHDAGAYRRSKAVAEDMAKATPAAIFDLHRDGIPDAEEYTHEIDGADTTKVRLEVGRGNANADANRTFAKAIKSAADARYPGFIKDIYVGKGNYNQEVYPKALLLEFGTHTSDKEEVMEATKYMAEVVDTVLFGEHASAAGKGAAKGAGAGIAWVIGLAAVAAILYALVATGTWRGMMNRIGRGASEITGGLIGKKPPDGEE